MLEIYFIFEYSHISEMNVDIRKTNVKNVFDCW